MAVAVPTSNFLLCYRLRNHHNRGLRRPPSSSYTRIQRFAIDGLLVVIIILVAVEALVAAVAVIAIA